MKHLHIISFDIPYPANYGGAIDVFYRIKSLHNAGIKIILHCWHKDDRSYQPILDSLCEKVYYYRRQTNLIKQFGLKPYAVLTRSSQSLINNLLKDNYPILFEGLVSCYYINSKHLKNRVKLFRECNVEHDYYKELAKASSKLSNKIYFYIEALKLKFFEHNLSYANYILALSHNDEKYFISQYPKTPVIYLPCAHPNETISINEGIGNYILYHGNLAVAENEKAALYLCNNIFSKLKNIKCVIAGRNPQKILIDKVSQLSNVELICNPDETTMSNLIQNAHIHLLITFQNTGIKLKLLNTLFAGKHIIANNLMVDGSDTEILCHIANTPKEQIAKCQELILKSFSKEEKLKRKKLLLSKFSNSIQSDIISQLIQNMTN
jgi:hypothetical protein